MAKTRIQRPSRRLERRLLGESLLASAFLVGAVWFGLDWWTASSLLNHGATAPAKITSMTIDASGRFSVDVINYEFAADDGKKYLARERFANGPNPDAPPGEIIRRASKDDLAVRYRADDPRIHHLEVGLPTRVSKSRFWTIALFGTAVMIGGWAAVRHHQSREE